MSDIFSVIADPTRRDLLDLLLSHRPDSDGEGEASVSELVEALGLTQPTVSKHLKVLRDAGLVSVREEGQHRFYRLTPEPLEAVEDWMVPLLSADFDSSHDGSTVFAAWAGSSLPEPLRKVAERIDQPGPTGEAIGRTAAEATHQVRTVIEGAAHAIEGVAAGAKSKVIDPIREKLQRD